jgi:D-aminopeptidase
MQRGVPPGPRGPRLRELGLRIGGYEAGPVNAITDVPGIAVGHVTVWRDEPEPSTGRGIARTGVTAIVPGKPESLFGEPVPAGGAVLNGAGEMTGFHVVLEWGLVETPVYLTSTMAVGRVFDGAVAAAVAADPRVGVDDVVIPVVAECDDSGLSDPRLVQVEAGDAGRAVAGAVGGSVPEGAVGAGTGMSAFGWKAGIGTASRIVPALGATVGVLALVNLADGEELRMDGVPVGRLLPAPDRESRRAGSCIVVVATDAPLASAQLHRLARRAGLGLGRIGSVAYHGSGEIFLALSTGARRPRDAAPTEALPDRALDDLFPAVVDATEEAVLNALWAAPDVAGRAGRLVRGIPHEDVLALLRSHGRLRSR